MTFGQSPFTRRPGQFLDYSAHEGTPAVVSFFNAVYGWMAAGLALTGIMAWQVSSHWADWARLFNGPTLIILFVAEIGLVITISAAINRINATAATVLFLVYAALNGLTLAPIFMVYTAASVATAFIACAAMFGVMSVYGMLTQNDLSSLGRIMMMGLIGIIIASVVNMFAHSPALNWIISYGGVAVFIGLTAYDTQRLRQVAIATAENGAMAARLSISGALILYLDFINLFLMLLRLLGNRRN